MKALYKYPQLPFPYADLVATNRERSRTESEYELIDTGIFNENRYFDIFIEYAKHDMDDILVRATVINRGPDAGDAAFAADGLVPQHLELGLRNATAGVVAPRHPYHRHPGTIAGRVQAVAGGRSSAAVHRKRKQHRCGCGATIAANFITRILFTAMWSRVANAVNPDETGTKACGVYRMELEPGGSKVLHFRLYNGEGHRA